MKTRVAVSSTSHRVATTAVEPAARNAPVSVNRLSDPSPGPNAERHAESTASPSRPSSDEISAG